VVVARAALRTLAAVAPALVALLALVVVAAFGALLAIFTGRAAIVVGGLVAGLDLRVTLLALARLGTGVVAAAFAAVFGFGFGHGLTSWAPFGLWIT
jgi:hypothetical protein